MTSTAFATSRTVYSLWLVAWSKTRCNTTGNTLSVCASRMAIDVAKSKYNSKDLSCNSRDGLLEEGSLGFLVCAVGTCRHVCAYAWHGDAEHDQITGKQQRRHSQTLRAYSVDSRALRG